MSTVTITKMYDDVSSKLGKESTENLILLIEQKISAGMENILKLMATREDVHKVEQNILKVEQKLEGKLSELKTDIANVKIEIGHIKFELLKWVIGLWITNTLMILGLYLTK